MIQRLNEIRIQKGLTIEALAKSCDMSDSTVKNVLSGKTEDPRLSTLAPIAKALGVTLDELIYPKGEEKPKEPYIIALKDMYEYQLASKTEHYESQIEQITKYYEHIIEEKDKQIDEKEKHYERLLQEAEKHIETIKLDKRWFRIGFVVSVFIFAMLCIAELLNPNLGWFRY